MGGSEADVGCKKHLNLQLLPGVCSSCLRERLLQLSGSVPAHSSLSSSPPYFSAAASSSSSTSPPHQRLFISGGSSGLRKSRSLPFAVRSRVRDGTGGKKKGAGFWSKLLGKRTKDLVFVHSRTVSVKDRFHY